jgi:probable HAF family extracellular repeat protein
VFFGIGINASGQIVGDYPNGIYHGFLLSGGNYTSFDVPGAFGTFARGINASGQIVGGYLDAGHMYHGFLLSGGNYTTFDVPGGNNAFAHAINASGQIVGSYNYPNQQGFLFSGGSYTTIDVPGSIATDANGINDAGQIVGGFWDASGEHGFVLSGGNSTTIDFPGAVQTSVLGINNAGQIVGFYNTDPSGNNPHGFLATPVSPFAWHGPESIVTGVTGNPSLVQAVPGTYGTRGNYELAVPLQGGGIGHFYRNNDDPNLPWSGPFTFGTDHGVVNAVCLIQSNFSSHVAGNESGSGNLAVVARIGNELDYFFREDVGFTWSGAVFITNSVTGVPSFIQATPGTYGTMGNYELVVPLQSGGLAHFYRDNDNPNLPWTQTATFGTELGVVDAVSLIQSNFSTAGNGPGNLAVVARVGNALVYFYRDDLAPFAWHGPTPIFTGVSGNPSFIQARPGTYGTKGNYELVVPLQGGGIGHFYRDNDDPNLSWSGPTPFATDQGAADAVSLIQSNFSTTGNGPGNLAVVCVAANALSYFYRDD